MDASQLNMESCRRPCTITLYTPSGTTRFRTGPTPYHEIKIDWEQVIELILGEHHAHELVQLHLITGDHPTCFAAGNSFARLIWVDLTGWQALLQTWCSAEPLQQDDPGHCEISIAVTITQVLPFPYTVLHANRERFAITTIRSTKNGHDLALTHATTKVAISRDSEQLWHWQNEERVSIGLMTCAMLIGSMPLEHTTPCMGCAQLLLATGGPARRPRSGCMFALGRVFKFPAHNETCTCGPQQPTFIFVSSIRATPN